MKIVNLGVSELDRNLGGGIPHPSLASIEGEYGSGKTIFVQQMVHAMLESGLRYSSFPARQLLESSCR